MNEAETERQHTEEQIIIGEVADADLEAAANTEGKTGCVTYIACTSLALSCPG